MKISKLDHFVLTVRDIEKTVSFYTSVMGMKKEVFGQGRVALKYGDQKINLHEFGNEFEPKAGNPTPGSADLCFLTEMPLNEALSHVKSCGAKIIEGPVERRGAKGSLLSILEILTTISLRWLIKCKPQNTSLTFVLPRYPRSQEIRRWPCCLVIILRRDFL